MSSFYARAPRRCKFYDNAGNPCPSGPCRGIGTSCRFVHPGDPRWATALPAPNFVPRSASFAGPSIGATQSNTEPLGAGSAWGAPRKRKVDDEGGRDKSASWNAGSGWGSAPAPDWGGEWGSSNKEPEGTKQATSGWGSSDNSKGWDSSKPTSTGWGSPAAATSGGWGSPARPNTFSGWGSPPRPNAFSGLGSATKPSEPPNASGGWGSPARLTASSHDSNAWGNEEHAPAGQDTSSAPQVSFDNTTTSGSWGSPQIPTTSSDAPQPLRSPIRIQAHRPRPVPPASPKFPVESLKRRRADVNSREQVEDHDERDRVDQNEHALYPGMLVASASVPASDMVLPTSEDVIDTQPLVSGPMPECDIYLEKLSKAICLHRSLEEANELQHDFKTLQDTQRYSKLRPGYAAFDKISDLCRKQQVEIDSLKRELVKVCTDLQSLSLPPDPSSLPAFRVYEEKARELEAYACKIEGWLSKVDSFKKDQAVDVDAIEAFVQRISQSETRLANLEDYAGDLQSTGRIDLEKQLDEKVLHAKNKLIPIYEECVRADAHADLQDCASRMKFLQDQLVGPCQGFEEGRRQAVADDNANLKSRMKELEDLTKKTGEVCQANEREISQLKVILRSLEASTPSPPILPQAPPPVISQDDLLIELIPRLSQLSRQDLEFAYEALHAGVQNALEEHENRVTSEVWESLEPVLKFAQHVQRNMEKATGRGQAYNSE